MKRLRSLTSKNFIMIAGILLLSYILTGLVFSITFYRYAYSENLKSMSSALQQAARLVAAYDAQWEPDDIEMQLALTTTASFSGCDIIVTDSLGNVVSCSDTQFHCHHVGMTVPKALLDSVPATGAYSGLGYLNGIYSGQRQYIAARLSKGSETEGYIIMSVSVHNVRALWRESIKRFGVVAGLVAALAAIITFAASSHQTEPINEMARMTARFARGELEARVPYDGRQDEIGQLQRSLNYMAESLNRTEATRRELIANVSHDLKTPITTISGFSDGILDGTIPPEKAREYLKTISSESKRMSRMVQNMLTLSRMQAVDPAEMLRGSFDICEIMRICLLGLEGRIEEKQLDVVLTLPEEEIITRGDPDSITRVVTNLMDNAVKFATPGTPLVLEVWKQNGKAYVSVQNQGETIPKEELPRIFERFHKSDKSRNLDKSGSGLGLFIVKSIIDSHQEDIFVASENGTTRFVFTLTLRTNGK